METRFTNNYRAIEDEADSLIDHYERKFGPINSLFTPVEIIAEQLLEIRIDLSDLEDDIIGCIDVINKEIYINRSLDPIVNKKMEGRYNFTLAHEMGHLVLHKDLVEQSSIAAPGKSNNLLCRTSENKAPIEKQADYFAGCLLMPRKKLWETLKDKTGGYNTLRSISRINKTRETNICIWSIDSYDGYDGDGVLEEFYSSLANDFKVSPLAMVIRLKQIGHIIKPRY